MNRIVAVVVGCLFCLPPSTARADAIDDTMTKLAETANQNAGTVFNGKVLLGAAYTASDKTFFMGWMLPAVQDKDLPELQKSSKKVVLVVTGNLCTGKGTRQAIDAGVTMRQVFYSGAGTPILGVSVTADDCKIFEDLIAHQDDIEV